MYATCRPTQERNMASWKKYALFLLLCFGITTVLYVSHRKRGVAYTQNTEKLQNTGGRSTVLRNNIQLQRTIDNSPQVSKDIDELSKDVSKSTKDLSTLPKDLSHIFVYDWKRTQYQLNITRSMEIPVDRVLPSTVPEKCSTQRYLSRRPMSVSIVIPFYAEHWTVLFRILHCIFHTVPDQILQQVILVDDANDEPNLGEPLEQYLNNFPKVALIRLKQRHGLIKARMAGAKVATGDVLVFVDAHVEMEEGWIEPLLQAIEKNITTVAVPQAHALNRDTLKPFKADTFEFGSFTWTLDYFWMTIPKKILDSRASTFNNLDPIPTATMIGCVFAMHRGEFFRLGGLDDGLEVWGGENLELSFRTWMCGGRVVIVPCSVTYHIYRAFLPYEVPSDAIHKNLQRVALTWMGDYAQHFFHTTGRVVKFNPDEQASLISRRHLKSRLKCRDFRWYLDNVASNLLAPPRLALLWGQLKNLKVNRCMYSESPSNLGLNPCAVYQPTQTFYFNTESELVHQESGLCVTNKHGMVLTLEKCVLFTESQTWNFSPIYPDTLGPYIIGVEVHKPIGAFWMFKHGSRLCLDLVLKESSNIDFPGLRECESERLEQYWLFMHKINDHINGDDALDKR